jgi:hypothetical protein
MTPALLERKTFDFSTLHSTIPHVLLNAKLKRIDSASLPKEEQRTKVSVSSYL